MELEEQLTNKRYYETWLEEGNTTHPVLVLGTLYHDEQKHDVCDLSYIRFAQGEVYFHNKDFEAAIFKWENISNDLEAWAKKNMADAYFELDLLDTAEKLYRSISSESLLLKTEVALKLYSLYIQQGNNSAAKEVIKKTVSLNPGYPSVADTASEFFEEQEDWGNAIDLALNEAVRTGDQQWYQVLKSYADKQLVHTIEPSYFNQALVNLHGLDAVYFKELVASFWNSYRNEDMYTNWIKEINELIKSIEIDKQETSWKELTSLYQDTYLELTSGKYLLADLTELIPDLLTNWFRLVDSGEVIFPASAIVAWSEIDPSSIEPTIGKEAEVLLEAASKVDKVEEIIHLYDTIISWADKQQLNIGDHNEYLEHKQAEKILFLIKNMIKVLFKKQIESENALMESIHFNKDMLSKLNGVINQLGDVEKEKVKLIVQSFRSIKEKVKSDIEQAIPKLLKNCSELINDDSDSRNLHLAINSEMNNRIQHYLKDDVLPNFYQYIQGWIADSYKEFNHSKSYLDEISSGFNTLYGEERVMLECDFKVLDDWRRDAERMTSGIHLENLDIILKFSPAQFLLKSAGKLLGSLSQKTTLNQKYKSYIENKNYDDVVEGITKEFFLQFELFEKSLDRDITMFFRSPFQVLEQLVENTNDEIEGNNHLLSEMKSHPEIIEDALTIFELRVRQLELMTKRIELTK